MTRSSIRRGWCAASALLLLSSFLSAACASSDTASPADEATATATPVAQPTATAAPTPPVEPSPTEAPSPTPAPPPTEAATPTPSPPPTPAETPTPAPPAPPDRPDAPWASRPLAASAVPAFLIDAWNASERSGPALFPARIGAVHPAAAARRAEFSGGWGVAWDRPAGPGRNADGSYCGDCGRSAFGVAAIPSDTVLDDLRDEAIGWIEWADGSRAGWWYEGFADPASGAPLLMYLEIPEYPTLYQVWSFLGENDLLALVERLRFVDGLGPAAR